MKYFVLFKTKSFSQSRKVLRLSRVKYFVLLETKAFLRYSQPAMSENIPPQDKKIIKRLIIPVTQEDIDTAHKAKADGCMIRNALHRKYPKFKSIWVDKNQVRCTDPEANCIYTFDMHPRGRVMLLKWDSGENVPPFDLYLRHPVVRERQLISGAMRSPRSHSAKHHGPVANPKTQERRAATGRDRVFGRKLWAEELAQVRTDLGVVV